MSERLRLIGTGLLCVLVLGLTIFFAVQLVQAVPRFQKTRHQVLVGDVQSIRPWMTIPYVSKVYHVPESYLLEALHIAHPASVEHVTVHVLAAWLHRTAASLIRELQTAIQTYRGSHTAQLGAGGSPSILSPSAGTEKT